MPRYGEQTDGHMREVILRELSARRLAVLSTADNQERQSRDAYWSVKVRAEFAKDATSHRRRAAHYQQAIDLLTAAPMPPVEAGSAGRERGTAAAYASGRCDGRGTFGSYSDANCLGCDACEPEES